MRPNLSGHHWMQHMHLSHLHPVHWLATHPVILSFLIAVLVAATMIGLVRLANSASRMDTQGQRTRIPALYP